MSVAQGRDDEIREVYLPVSDVYRDPARCPACGCRNILREGCWQRNYTEALEEGNITNETLEDEVVKVLYAIVCPKCTTRFRILKDNTFREKRDIINLKRRLAEIPTATPTPVSKEVIN